MVALWAAIPWDAPAYIVNVLNETPVIVTVDLCVNVPETTEMEGVANATQFKDATAINTTAHLLI